MPILPRTLLLFITLSLLTACSPPLSPTVRARVNPDLTLAAVRAAPAAHIGETLLLAGAIVHVRLAARGTELEVRPWQSSFWGEPLAPDAHGENFLAVTEQHLDPTRYQAGRLVTLAASVRGPETRSFEAVTASYLLVQILEIHLWPGPLHYGLHPSFNGQDEPDYDPPWYERDNPYDPGYHPYPYTPVWLRSPQR